MKEFFKWPALLLCASLFLFACDDSEDGAKTVVKLDRAALTLNVGGVRTLAVEVTPPRQDAVVVWSSDNEAVAIVADGTVTAVAVGEAVIEARVGTGFAACKVTVAELTLDRSELVLEVGGSQTLTATVVSDALPDKTVVWTSSDSAVAAIEDGVVTAVALGTATITATVGELSAACAVTVVAAPKIGDYFYSDGTWSDGGLQSIDADGLNPVWAAAKPAPVAGKTVIGIVCQTAPDRIAQSDRDAGYTHGYVVAVKNVHGTADPTVRFSDDYDFASTPQAKLASTWYTNVNGYAETMKVVEDYGANLYKCPAFDYTINTFPLEAPAGSSGWFLPSTGQLWDMVANLCGNEVAVFLKQWQTSNYNVYNGYNSETVGYDVIAKFNETISLIPADQKEELFVTDDYYNTCTLWASTSFDPGETACVIHLGGPTKPLIELMCEYIDYDGIARPILAF